MPPALDSWLLGAVHSKSSPLSVQVNVGFDAD
jgi:hypothetical protein